MIDRYFRKPILWDFIISVLIIGIIIFFQLYGMYDLPKVSKIVSVTDDIGSIGLTVSGFIITVITILLTLKSGQILSDEELENNSPPFRIFLASELYTKSINILKYGVYSLVLVSMASYVLKMSLKEEWLSFLGYFNVLGLVVILTTFFRSFYVLGQILKMQGNA